MAWVADAYDEVTIKTLDQTGQGKTSSIRVAAATSDADIQAIIAAEQAGSNGSLASYVRHKGMTDDAAAAPVTFDPSVNPLNLLSTALDCEFSCGPSVQPTRTSILCPSNAHLIAGNRDKLVLDPTSSVFTNLQAAAVAAMVNTGGDAVATLQRTQIQTRKSRMLEGV